MPQWILGAHSCRDRGSTNVRRAGELANSWRGGVVSAYVCCGGVASANAWLLAAGVTAAGASETMSAGGASAEADRLNTTIPRAVSPRTTPAKNRIGLNQFANAAQIKVAAVSVSAAVKPRRP